MPLRKSSEETALAGHSTDPKGSKPGPDLTPHPYALLFPPLSPDAFAALVADIQVNDQREPIIINAREQIIDGVNRYRACLRLNKTPKFQQRDISDEQALALIITANVVRRHMSETQRAAVAAELRKSANLPIKQVALAKTFNVSERILRSAERILEVRPDLHEKLKVDEITVHRAEAILALPIDDRNEAIEFLNRGDIKSAKAKVRAAKPRRVSRPTKQKTWTEKRSTAWHHDYASLFHAADELPQLLVDHPLSPEQIAELVAALRKALDLVESVEGQN